MNIWEIRTEKFEGFCPEVHTGQNPSNFPVQFWKIDDFIYSFWLNLTFNNNSISLQVSGLVLGGLSIWTYVDHAAFLAVIPNVTYKIVVYLTFATGSFICLVSLVGICTVKHTWKSCTSIVSFLPYKSKTKWKKSYSNNWQ